GQTPLRAIPQFLTTASPRDHQLSHHLQVEEHHADVAAVVPAAAPPGAGRPILEGARGQWATFSDLAHHATSQRVVRLHPCQDAQRLSLACSRKTMSKALAGRDSM